MTRLPLVVLLSAWIAAPAFAGPVFPPFKRSKSEEQTTEPVAQTVTGEREEQPVDQDSGVDTEAPAVEAPADGIWEWVDRMEGEIPTEEQVEAIEEHSESENAERALIDELAGAEPPERFYKDPVAALTVDPLYLDRVDPSEFDIPIAVNADVRKWVQYFTGPGRKYYERYLMRSTRYRPMMYEHLEAAGLPRDLVYLSMIESGYNAHAYSHAAAAGLWQFIPSTARLYKMRVDWWVDDRRDPERSLEAAIDFLGELHDIFDDWQLAWASYNTGPGRVRRAVEKAGTKDFYALVKADLLHPETENYVPKIQAAAIIGKHPERYGFTNIPYQEELKYEVAPVEGSVELSVIARCAGTDTDTLKALNPALRRFATPPEGYDVRLPIGTRDRMVAELAKVPKAERVTVVKHTVTRGETLSLIAGKYGVSVSSISAANNLRNVNRIAVGMTLVIPKHGQEIPPSEVASASRGEGSVTASRSSTVKAAPAPAAPVTHTVRAGDTLSTIAARYGTSVSAIQSRNGLKGSTIYVGQKLKVSGSSTSSSTATASAAPATTKHTVRSGETLSSIAARYGVRATDLQSWNRISNASHITVGQVLTVKGGSSGGSSSGSDWKTYAVRSGDSLGKIASANDCTVSELQQWNNLSGSVIHPGQTLRIRAN